MRILAANKFYHVAGGSDRYFFELNALLRAAGHEVVPFAMRHPRNEPTPFDRYFVSEVAFWGPASWQQKVHGAFRTLYSREARRVVARLLREQTPSVAHVHLVYHHISPSFLPILRDHGVPIIQTLHDYKPVCPTYSLFAHGRICERCRGGRFYHAALERCNRGSVAASALNSLEMYLHSALGWYALASTFIVPSEFMRAKLIEMGMDGRRLVHIPNFVDPAVLTARRRVGGERYVVYAGRLVAIKGVATLIRAVGRCRADDLRLVIVGDGPAREELETVSRREAAGRVSFAGYQSGQALQQLVADAVGLVIPSECYENCPMIVLEAMALGTPVVGSRIGGIPELIRSQETGYLFEPGNADELAEVLERLWSEPPRAAAMGQAGQRRVEQEYGPARHLKRVLRVYSDALSDDTVSRAQGPRIGGSVPT